MVCGDLYPELSSLGRQVTAKPRLGVIALLPSYYQDKIWRGLALCKEIETEVIYLSDVGLRQDFIDRTLKAERHWSERIDLGAYRNRFLRNFGSQERPGPLFRVNPALVAHLARSRFDAVLLPGHTNLSTFAAALTCRLIGTPVIYRGEAVTSPRDHGWRRRLKARFDTEVLGWFAVVMYSCTGNRTYFEQRGVAASKMIFIPCAVENGYYQAEYRRWLPHRSEIRAELGIPATDLVAVYIGQLLPRKRVAEIPLAAARLRELAPEVSARLHWLIIGDGPERAEIEQRVAAHGLTNVRMTGFCDQKNLGRYLVGADIGLVLSDYDPSPKVLNEMMNFGLPVLCTEPVGTAFDLVRDGRNGFVVPVGEPTSVAERIAAIVRTGRLAQMGEESRRIVSRFSFDADIDAIVEAVQRVVGRPRRPWWGRLRGPAGVVRRDQGENAGDGTPC